MRIPPVLHVRPGSLEGRVQAPPSKSHLQRLLLLASQADGISHLRAPGASEDGRACRAVVEALGAAVQDLEKVEGASHAWRVLGPGRAEAGLLDCGESAFCFRAAAPLAARKPGPFALRARGSLLCRPADPALEALTSLGARLEPAPEGLTVRGPLRGGGARVDARTSSQGLSGLLMALPLAPEDSELEVEGPCSLPYLRMTLELMAQAGVRVQASPALDRFHIPGGQRYRPLDRRVEGDWSAAAFLLAAGAIAGDLEILGLRRESLQADRRILEVLELAGADPVWEEDGALRIRRATLRAFSFDASHCPDLVPPLAALACHAQGTSILRGAARLRLKESDRLEALCAGLGALGARIEAREDSLVIQGGPLQGGRAQTQGDHRIAMACAVAALRSRKGVILEGAGAVSKSYPAFFHDLETLGATP